MPDNPSRDTAPTGNVLRHETSPYLLQHKDNPVDWQPWSEGVFTRARTENKPILLSVGYSACHWCHVMAHESFEDDQIAALMNELYINVKVDREERPDVDALYQAALSLLGEQGGWPLTMFLTPDGEPFWGGTYFPPVDRYGRPGFTSVLTRIAEIYRQEPDKIAQNVTAIKTALADLSGNKAGDAPTPHLLNQMADQFYRLMDHEHGGLGGAPKFPQPAVLDFLWRASCRTGDQRYRDSVILTLRKMSQGGIYDHLGGGFARYSTDAFWLAPHFEKMLYDNAQLLPLLVRAWQATAEPLFLERAEETVDWLVREMRQPGGAFAGTLDADSEGEEGRFYVWTKQQIDATLGSGRDADLFRQSYDVTKSGNWEGKIILNRTAHPDRLPDSEESALKKNREKLLRVRNERVRPGLDDKILVDWNAMAIQALASSGKSLGRPNWVGLAQDAYSFIQDTMWRDPDHLFHSHRDGQNRNPGTLDDYVQLAAAALALFDATRQQSYLTDAVHAVEIIVARFHDAAHGGYYLSDSHVTDLPVRTKTAYDNATPSGNGALVHVFAALYHQTGLSKYRERADALIRAFSGEVQRNALAIPVLAAGVEQLEDTVSVVIVGDTNGGADTLEAAARAVPDPRILVQRPGDTAALPDDHPAAGKTTVDGAAAAYVCRGQTCTLPILDPEALRHELTAY